MRINLFLSLVIFFEQSKVSLLSSFLLSGSLMLTLCSLVISWILNPLAPMMVPWYFWGISTSIVTWDSWKRLIQSWYSLFLDNYNKSQYGCHPLLPNFDIIIVVAKETDKLMNSPGHWQSPRSSPWQPRRTPWPPSGWPCRSWTPVSGSWRLCLRTPHWSGWQLRLAWRWSTCGASDRQGLPSRWRFPEKWKIRWKGEQLSWLYGSYDLI